MSGPAEVDAACRASDVLQARLCLEPGCDTPMWARGLCNKHYKQRQRAGILPPRPSLASRLWASVARTEGCWLWTGSVNGRGWGYISHEGVMRLVHRVSYELAHGPPSEGMVIRHMCGNRLCVRPEHLVEEPQTGGTPAETPRFPPPREGSRGGPVGSPRDPFPRG